MKLLGLDYGSIRVGIAISDEEKTMAFPHSIVTPNNVLASVNTLCVQEQIEKIVVGLPAGLSGQATAQTKVVQDFIDNLRRQISVPIVTEDERLTSVLASALNDQTKKKRGSASAVAVDDVAAAMILQSYLDRSKNQEIKN